MLLLKAFLRKVNLRDHKRSSCFDKGVGSSSLWFVHKLGSRRGSSDIFSEIFDRMKFMRRQEAAQRLGRMALCLARDVHQLEDVLMMKYLTLGHTRARFLLLRDRKSVV